MLLAVPDAMSKLSRQEASPLDKSVKSLSGAKERDGRHSKVRRGEARRRCGRNGRAAVAAKRDS